MNLLFITRKVDKDDSRTGFVFDWLNEFAQNLDKLTVICLEMGDTSGLSGNIEVFSMGKEKGKDRLKEFFNYLELLRKWVPLSDGVFVHMHPIYAVIASIFTKIFSKKLLFWYTHKSVDLKLKLAVALVDGVLSASPESFRYPTEKAKFLGHGINLNRFNFERENTLPENNFLRILSVSRISNSKRIDLVIDSLSLFKQNNPNINFICTIVGGAESESEINLLENYKEKVLTLGLRDYIKFVGPVGYPDLPKIYKENDLFVNFSETGSLDKAVLEAMASGCLVLTSNFAFSFLEHINKLLCVKPDKELISNSYFDFYNLNKNLKQEISQKLKNYMEENHNLSVLVKKIINEYK